MKYPEEFNQLVDKCIKHKQFVGFGSPTSEILIIGKEVSTDTDTDSNTPLEIQNSESIKRNANDWKNNIINEIESRDVKKWDYNPDIELCDIDNNPLFPWKGTIKKQTSDTWKKYQKLHDIIYNGKINSDNSIEVSFLDNFFITEMNQNASRTTNAAQNKSDFIENLEFRKEKIIDTDYFKRFPVVILACSNYIWNVENDRQITNIFDVKFDKEFSYSSQNKYRTHYNESGKRLVIHTRQLSMAVLDNMLIGMGNLIRNHLDKISKN